MCKSSSESALNSEIVISLLPTEQGQGQALARVDR
jgi:hypothetical protein